MTAPEICPLKSLGAKPQQRVDEIDFWRGLALIIIFINHFQGNVVSFVTPKNYGFSDSAEAFVFLSGLSTSLAYKKYFSGFDYKNGCIRILRQVNKIYTSHIILTIIAILFYLALSHAIKITEILDVEGRGSILNKPIGTIVGIFSLTHQLGYFNILPLYVLFLLISPVLLFLGAWNRWLMIFLSLSIYILARLFDLNIPSWPEKGTWYFNPLAWQLLFTLGVFFGFRMGDSKLHIANFIYNLALIFTLIAAILVSNAFGTIPGLVDVIGQGIDWDKSQLGLIRLIDFLALACVIYNSNISDKFKTMKLYQSAKMIGRNGLLIYIIGSLLSAGGTIIKEAYSLTYFFDILYVAFGMKLLHCCAIMSDKRKSLYRDNTIKI